MKIAVDLNTLQPKASPRFPGANTIGDIANLLLSKYFCPLLGFFLLLYLVFAGYEWMVSQGNPKAIESARNKILWGIVGFCIIFAAYWVVQIVGKILGIEAINDIFGG
jgi:hypothetical protein